MEQNDVTIPLSVKERKEWFEYYRKLDPFIGNYFDMEPVNEHSLMSALLVKCVECDRLREQLLNK